MKKIAWIFFALIFVSCGKEHPFQFLSGKWKQTNAIPDVDEFGESWELNEEGHIIGTGFFARGGDTLSREKMKMEERSGVWNYVVEVENDKESVAFALKGDPYKDSLVFENSENNFPARLVYVRKDFNHLHVYLYSKQAVELSAPGEVFIVYEKQP